MADAFTQAGCNIMFLPNDPCQPKSFFEQRGAQGCCTPGFTCAQNTTSPTNYRCSFPGTVIVSNYMSHEQSDMALLPPAHTKHCWMPCKRDGSSDAT